MQDSPTDVTAPIGSPDIEVRPVIDVNVNQETGDVEVRTGDQTNTGSNVSDNQNSNATTDSTGDDTAGTDGDEDGEADPAVEVDGEFLPVDFSALHNCVLHDLAPGAPTGVVQLGGVPFHIPTSGNNIWDGWSAGGPGTDKRTVEIALRVTGAREVHTLINTDWGTEGGPFAWLEFFGSKGAYHRKDLYTGVDIRDHSANNAWASGINGTTTVNVWDNGASGSNYVVLDKQRIALPEEFSAQELETIRLTDAGHGEYHQRIMLVGVTVKTR
jgi:hypothetical protein